MSLPNPGMDAVPFTPLTAEFLDDMIENIESLSDGTGLENSIITAPRTSFGGNYSTSEVNTGFTWIDGKPIYKKTINFGSLPNNGSKDVAHGITTIDKLIDLFGGADDGTGVQLPTSYAHPSSPLQFYIASGGTVVRCQTSSDRTAWNAYVTLLYTKV